MGKGTISASVGITLGSSEMHGTSYSITLNKNEKKTIIYRPKITQYKIIQAKYRYDNYTGARTIVDTEVAYVTGFRNWDYSWKY